MFGSDLAIFLFTVIDELSEQAFRVLAVAYKPMNQASDTSAETAESDLIFAGLVASIDPERLEVGPSIRIAANAGIRTVMITGGESCIRDTRCFELHH